MPGQQFDCRLVRLALDCGSAYVQLQGAVVEDLDEWALLAVGFDGRPDHCRHALLLTVHLRVACSDSAARGVVCGSAVVTVIRRRSGGGDPRDPHSSQRWTVRV